MSPASFGVRARWSWPCRNASARYVYWAQCDERHSVPAPSHQNANTTSRRSAMTAPPAPGRDRGVEGLGMARDYIHGFVDLSREGRARGPSFTPLERPLSLDRLMSSAPIVSMHEVTRRFGPVLANDRVSLDLVAGEVHALVGENGAGKSTLMKVLYGLHPPDSGNIRDDGRVVRIDNTAAA